jgi:hypothetical protein
VKSHKLPFCKKNEWDFMGNNGLPSGDLIEKSSIYGFRFTPSKKT